uniref:Adenosylcobinamide-GDP ribazoletransferase n=1 Tax=Cyanothece sp. (strain PCC 7425 / ATCC 29141) TaxID=395961 RepID=B8HQQ6_CYAP4
MLLLTYLIRQCLGAIAFYTCIPIPTRWNPEFNQIARWSPLVGLLIGGILGGMALVFQLLGIPVLTRSTLVVILWMLITGGLHLDGLMDTADGLAVMDRSRRLTVMADSHSGAFGVMAAIALVVLKIAALSEIAVSPLVALMTVAAWGRWGQVVAIACYPYLKPTGKGALHKASLKLPQDLLLASSWLMLWSGGQCWLFPHNWLAIGLVAGIGAAIGGAVGAWINGQLGGQTGDTYGAIVEVTETLLLCVFTVLKLA